MMSGECFWVMLKDCHLHAPTPRVARVSRFTMTPPHEVAEVSLLTMISLKYAGCDPKSVLSKMREALARSVQMFAAFLLGRQIFKCKKKH